MLLLLELIYQLMRDGKLFLKILLLKCLYGMHKQTTYLSQLTKLKTVVYINTHLKMHKL